MVRMEYSKDGYNTEVGLNVMFVNVGIVKMYAMTWLRKEMHF